MKRPLYYTFGNHMHWVDMQWLWGYDVLPGCVDDMLHLVEATGARGNLNFDAVGYEKMAAECPGALAKLAAAVQKGVVEPVGCSYGQPYGLFQGGESNVRQFTFGVRSTMRLLGFRPATFWEEEFYFFDQLPQILRRSGYQGASLFFQWTWHTPELPREVLNLIDWEGIDGSRLPALPRNALNVHQWPEDFDGLLAQGLVNELDQPAVVQWLELMPSRDWMCRSEVLLPRLTEMMSDARFDVRPRTAQQLITELAGGEGVREIPTRRYGPDEVWHGITLGKNADRHPRTSRETEQLILAAESMSALASLLGRPYPSWDVYPTWEIDEAWRELLAAQHHDNHECEGLCGFVGYHQMAKAQDLASEVIGRVQSHLEDRSGGPVSYNVLGWPRRVERFEFDEDGEPGLLLVDLPAFGYAGAECTATKAANATSRQDGPIRTLIRGDFEVDVNSELGRIEQIRSAAHPDGVLREGVSLLDLCMTVDGKRWEMPTIIDVKIAEGNGELVIFFDADSSGDDPETEPDLGGGTDATIRIRIPARGDCVDVEIRGLEAFARPDPGLVAALRMPIATAHAIASIRADSPYAIDAVCGGGRVSRKYPEGDWMTSAQWFEHIEGSIVSHRLIDLLAADGSGLLILHDGSQQWFRTAAGVEVILNAYDPWDERRYEPTPTGSIGFRFLPHGGLADVDRARLASEMAASCGDSIQWITNGDLFESGGGRPVGGGGAPKDHPIPTTFAPIEITGDSNILCQAFYRESMKSGEHLSDWAGHEMARRSNGACTHPFVVRLVEWNGVAGEVRLSFPGGIASAVKTNLMGEVGVHTGGGDDTCWLEPRAVDAPAWARDIEVSGGWHAVHVPLKPREIATVMVDLELGRKQWRNLDSKRSVWATIHRHEEAEKS